MYNYALNVNIYTTFPAVTIAKQMRTKYEGNTEQIWKGSECRFCIYMHFNRDVQNVKIQKFQVFNHKTRLKNTFLRSFIILDKLSHIHYYFAINVKTMFYYQ